jgi:hypothetical protein
MEWFNIDIKTPNFNQYQYILVHLRHPSDCCEYFVCEKSTFGADLSSNCVNHSQECGTHDIQYSEIDIWTPINQPERSKREDS